MRWLYGGGLVAAAFLGGALALGGAALLGGFGEGATTTRLVASPLSAGPISVKETGSAMTVNQIFRRAARGWCR